MIHSKKRMMKAKIKERAEARAKKIEMKRQFAIDQQSASQCTMFEEHGETADRILEQVIEERKEREAFESAFNNVGASQDVSLNDLFKEPNEETSIFERGAYSDDDIPF